jgi:hypothetical protein
VENYYINYTWERSTSARRRQLRLAELGRAEQRHRGITGPLFAYPHSDANPLGSGPGGFIQGFAIAGGAFYPPAGAFPAGYRDQYYFADFVNQFVGRFDAANGNAYAFARLSGAPVDLLVGNDGALYVLTRGGVTRISAP